MMADGKLTVKDMPHALRTALLNRGHSEDDRFTPELAVGEWCAWEIGDGWWAQQVLSLHQEACEALKQKEIA